MTGGEPRSALSHWRLIVALGLLGLVLGFLWGIADTPTWSATAGVAVESDSQGASQSRLERFAQRGESQEVATKAAGLLGSDVSGADLLSDVVVEPAREGGAVLVTATSESPDYAAAAADGYAEALVEVEGDPLALGSAASIPTVPTENRPASGAAAGGLLAGLLAGLLIAAIMAAARRRRRAPEVADATPWPERETVSAPVARPVEEPEDEPDPLAGFATRLGSPMLGSVSRSDAEFAGAESGIVEIEGGRLDDLRAVVVGLDLDAEDALASIAVAAIGEDDAGPAIPTGIALAAADAGHRVLLVETDLAAPVLAAELGIDPAPGLYDYLDGSAAPRAVLRTLRAEIDDADAPVGIACVPAGSGGDEASLGGEAFETLVGRLSRVYGLVVYASPPIPGNPGAEPLLGLVDGVVLVVGGDVPEEDLAAAEERLEGVRVVGVVVCEP